VDLLLVAVRPDGELVLVEEVDGVLVDRVSGVPVELESVVLVGVPEDVALVGV